MFPYRILLILGAGASRPYLFPTARELTNLILEQDENTELLANMGFSTNTFQIGNQYYTENPRNIFLQYHNWFETALLERNVEKHELEQFQERFRLSGSYSIDAFVADNEFYKPLASLMIAAILLRCEKQERLVGDWYQLLFNELIDEHGQDFPSDALSIVTFNYDRSLEMYLFQAFKNRYDLTAARAWELVNRIEIIHVYGSLGDLFDKKGSRSLGYGASAIRPAAGNLRLVSPRVESEHLVAIGALIDRSPRIVFLGFGFDRLNLEQIRIPNIGDKKVFASCCGLSSTSMVRAEQSLGKGNSSDRVTLPIGNQPPLITWGDRKDKAAEFLHNSLAWA